CFSSGEAHSRRLIASSPPLDGGTQAQVAEAGSSPPSSPARGFTPESTDHCDSNPPPSAAGGIAPVDQSCLHYELLPEPSPVPRELAVAHRRPRTPARGTPRLLRGCRIAPRLDEDDEAAPCCWSTPIGR